MDNLTHSLVGVLLSRAGLRRYTPHAASLCVVAANIPDLDILAGLDPETYLVYHRHLTHSLIAVPAMAAVAAVMILGWARLRAWLGAKSGGDPPKTSFGRLWAVALIPTLSHPLLDLTNSYGVRLWLPFSAHWSSWDALFIIDLVVWAILLAGVAAPAVLRRRETRAAWAAAALAALTLYIAAGAGAGNYIAQTLSERTFGGDRPLDVAVFPAPPSPLAWTAYVRTNEFDLWLPINLARLDQTDESAGRRFEPPAATEQIEAAWRTGLGRAYRQFARYPLAIVSPSADGAEVLLSDFRFMRYGRPGFVCVVRLDQTLRVLSAQFEF